MVLCLVMAYSFANFRLVQEASLSLGFFRQENTLWAAISSSQGTSQARDQTHTHVFTLKTDSLPSKVMGEAPIVLKNRIIFKNFML